MTNNTPAAKSRARRFALQALYQVQFAESSAGRVEMQFRQDHDMKRVDTDYFHDLLTGVMQSRGALELDLNLILGQETVPDVEAVPATNTEGQVDTEVPGAAKSEARSMDDLDAVAKAVLLIGAFELQQRIEIPYKVVLNESIELAKQFGGAESHRLVNQVLDKMARSNRKAEVEHEASQVQK